MYGLLVENFIEYIKHDYGEEMWEEIRQKAKVDQATFSAHDIYPESLIPQLCNKASQILGISHDKIMYKMGLYFVEFVGQSGYDKVLSVLGRHMRDFLNGLDNLHEYLKFSYKHMQPPSFFCESESKNGMILHYRSKRQGYAHYTMGQITQVAKHFYGIDMKIELIKEEMVHETSQVTFQLNFDNTAFNNKANLNMIRDEQSLSLKGNMLFEVFPFCILFEDNMQVKYIGNSMMQVLPGLIGKKITELFMLVRPLVQFTFESILRRTNNIFEIKTQENAFRVKIKQVNGNANQKNVKRSLTLKGQMMYMAEWKMILFLGTPYMPDLDSMVTSGLYINDLSMHDFSRDMVLAGSQQSAELQMALDQEQQKSQKLQESMKKLDEEMRRTDELLYQMIPKQVAERLRKGTNAVDTCETFESVTILFSDVVTFTEICSRITPMEVVSMLNSMYSIFDQLTETNNVYKVETIGDAYMVVGGAPERQPQHGELVCNMAMDMVDAITGLVDPSTDNHLRIRVGVHTGMVVAGVVGLKMPRYCLFGDAVNTASRMESTSEAMKIHVSQTTKDILPPQYHVEVRGEITVKGKGNMKTYWLTGREKRKPISGKDFVQQTSEIGPGSDTRRGSTASRAYSPITYEDVARSLTNTPQPNHTPATGPDKPRGRTFSNAGFSGATIPILHSTPKPSPTDEHIPQVTHAPQEVPAHHDLMGERIRSTTHEKPVVSSLALHHQMHSYPMSQPIPIANYTLIATQNPLPDVLIDNHHQHDPKAREAMGPPKVIPITTIEVRGIREVMDRGSSPIVSHHATATEFVVRNRVHHSHTCILL